MKFANSERLEQIIKDFDEHKDSELFAQNILELCLNLVNVYSKEKYSEFKDINNTTNDQALGESIGADDCWGLIDNLYNEIPPF
jgi:hypothetical protein